MLPAIRSIRVALRDVTPSFHQSEYQFSKVSGYNCPSTLCVSFSLTNVSHGYHFRNLREGLQHPMRPDLRPGRSQGSSKYQSRLQKMPYSFFPKSLYRRFLFIIAFQTKPKRKRARNFVHFLSSFRLRFGISFPYKMMIVRSFGFRVHYSVVVPLFKWDLVSFA